MTTRHSESWFVFFVRRFNKCVKSLKHVCINRCISASESAGAGAKARFNRICPSTSASQVLRQAQSESASTSASRSASTRVSDHKHKRFLIASASAVNPQKAQVPTKAHQPAPSESASTCLTKCFNQCIRVTAIASASSASTGCK